MLEFLIISLWLEVEVDCKADITYQYVIDLVYLSIYFTVRFKEHINTHPPADILDTEELLKLRAEVGAAPPGVDSDASVVKIASDVAPPGNPCMLLFITPAYAFLDQRFVSNYGNLVGGFAEHMVIHSFPVAYIHMHIYPFLAVWFCVLTGLWYECANITVLSL